MSQQIIVGICREDNPRDVDEAYGEGTYARLFLCSTCESADNLKPCHYCKHLFCADCLNEHEGGCGSVDPGSQRP